MKKNILLTLFVGTILLCLIISPQKYIGISFTAIETWAKVVLPALFPFFVFTNILTSLGYIKNISNTFKKVTYCLYKTPPISAYAFFMSILTGYPVGSKLISDLNQQGIISNTQARKCLTFTSNSGPMFIIGSVGFGMLCSRICGYIIYISHILGSIINGLFYRNLDDNSPKTLSYQQNTQTKTFASCINDSINSILLIGGIIIVAFIVTEVAISLNLFYPIIFLLEKFGINSNISTSILSGFLEMTKGSIAIANLNLNLTTKTILTCSIISFGGISTILQSMAFLKGITTYKFFFAQKITHMICSTIICAIICFIVL